MGRASGLAWKKADLSFLVVCFTLDSANEIDAQWHRADLQRGHGAKGAISCAAKRESGHQVLGDAGSGSGG